MKILFRSLLGLVLLGAALAAALPAQDLVKDETSRYLEANTAYEEANWDAAASAYEELIARGVVHADLYYNLGNALLRKSELGQAIAAYRQALRLDPRHRDALANLQFARRSAKDALEPPAPSVVITTLFFWHFAFGKYELLAASVVLNVLFWLLLALSIFRRRSELLRWSSILALLLLLAVGASTALHFFHPARVAVILPQEVEAKTSTRPGAVVRFRLHAGTELRVVELRDDWVRIALPDGEEGWIERAYAAIV